MNHALKAVAGVLLTTLLVVGGFFAATPASSAPDSDTQGCVITIAGIKVCGTILGQPLPEVVTVTVPPITLPPATVTLPQATRTVTITPEPVRTTETVTVAPQTVTGPAQPQATATETATATATATVTEKAERGDEPVTPDKPTATVTETVRPNGEPVPTVTETVEVETGQPVVESGTIEPDEDTPFFSPDIDFGDEDFTVGEAGIGLLSAILIIGLIVGSMAYGFHRGRKVEESEESNFLRNLLDRSKTNKE